MRWAVSASLLALTWALPIAAHTPVDHTAWDLLLKRHVASGLVDYEGLRQDRATLDRYVVSLQDVQPSQLGSREAQMAFWINAYNANVVKGVLDHYPIASVKEVRGFFDRIRYRVAGRELTLNEIEAEGRALGDWRIHFAVVCAATGCPVLRSEAYVPERIYDQLEEQTQHFIQDSRHGLRIEGDTLWASQIFKWYAKDFLPSKPLTAANLLKVLAPYAIPVMKQPPGWKYPTPSRLKFLDYDWTLNIQHY